ncbi:retrovirus-related pol polyprotein from transposon TNT 1-94 [Tanacetum coccineum]
MSSMQEDIQCASSDTRPPMLDRTDFESWQQRIRLYCLGKDNGENIMYKADIRATNILLQGIPKDIYSLINHYTDAKDIWENVKMILEGSELTKDDRESQLYDEFEHFFMEGSECRMPQFQQYPNTIIQVYYNSLAILTKSYKSHLPQINKSTLTSSNARNKAMVQDGRSCGVQDRGQNRGGIINPGPAKPIKCYNCNGLGHIARECPRPKRLQDSDYFKDKMLLMQAQENGAVLDEEQSLFLAGEQIINFDEDVDNSPKNDLALNMDHIFEDVECTRYWSFVNHLEEYHEVHEMQTDEQHNYVVDSDADYTSNSNIIPYDQYVEDNKDHVVQRNVSSVRNDALMSILDEMHEQELYKEEKIMVAIGYKNPLCLTRAKQAQSALYNGHVLVTTNHTPTVIHHSKDTSEIAEITRKRMLLKMQSPLCVENKVRIPPPPPITQKRTFLQPLLPKDICTPEYILSPKMKITGKRLRTKF